MASQKDRILTLGRISFRDYRQTFGIRKPDRRYHMYIIGQTGTGKSTLIENLVRQDIRNGEGLAILDPHGELVEGLNQAIPAHRGQDVIYFNVPDPSCSYGFNPLAAVPPDRRHLVASEIIEVFKNYWEKYWGSRMEQMLRNALITLLDQPQATLADIPLLFYDQSFREKALAHLTNQEVKKFWTKQYENWSPAFRVEATSPIANKVGELLANPLIHRILTKADPRLNLDPRTIMDQGKILLVNLAKGKLGPDLTPLIGSLLVSRIGVAALSRADQPPSERRDFYLYLDEFQNFTTLSLANMLSEVRKYHLNLILANQYLAQLKEEVRDAVLGNVGTIIAFRVGLDDALVLERVFLPEFSRYDLIQLSNYHIYLRMVIDGSVSRPFSAETLPPDSDRPLARFSLARISAGLRYIASMAVKWFSP